MKTITLTGYEYDELSREAQERVLQKMFDINVDFDWWDFDGLTGFSEAENKKYNLGGMYDDLLQYDKMYFSCARGRDWHLEFINPRFRDEEQARRFLGFDKRVWKQVKGCYSFESRGTGWYGRDKNTVLVFESDNGQRDWTKHEQEQIDRAIERFDDKREDCLTMLENEYEYQTSQEAIEETIRANNYLFDENGRMI